MAENRDDFEEEDEGAPSWMVTYGDMITLLLVFFVLLFSFAVVEDIQFENAIKSLQGALGVMTLDQGIMEKGERPQNKILNGAMDLGELDDFFRKFKHFVNTNNLQNVADVTFNEQGVVISLTNKVLYGPGSARLGAVARNNLKEILPLVRMYPYEINVIGHADGSKIRSRKYPTNWDLALDRAMSVMKFYTQLDPTLEKKFSLTSFGAVRPLILGGTEIRPELSRRVDLVFRRPDIDKKPAF